MKKVTFTIAALLFINTLFAEMIHTVFEDDGWVIGLNENVPVDIDEDGIMDFYINGWEDELGFVPIFAQGCFAGTGFYNNIGSSELLRMKPGEEVHMNSNPYFIDGDRGSVYGPNGDFAEGWSTSDQYIGFMVWVTGKYGWMRIAIDEENKQLVIKEWAINTVYGEPVIIGDTGESTVGINNLSNEIKELSLSPNPAVDQLLLSFNYQSDADLLLMISNSTGIEVYRQSYAQLPNHNKILINTSELSAGVYLLQLRSKDGVRTEQFVVRR